MISSKGISGEVRLVVSLALFAIAGAILYSLRYYLVWDQKLREHVWPKDIPRHVFGMDCGCDWADLCRGVYFPEPVMKGKENPGGETAIQRAIRRALGM